MTPVPHARTYARTNLVPNISRGGAVGYVSYPNWFGKTREDHFNRGALRVGVVEQNEDTESAGIDGYLAAVTHEESGEARFYIWDPEPPSGLWLGPYWALSEEIVPME